MYDLCLKKYKVLKKYTESDGYLEKKRKFVLLIKTQRI